MEEKRYLSYQGQRVAYYLERKRIKNINVHVRRDGSIYASAPRRAALGLVEQLLLEHLDQLLASAQQRIQVQAREAQALAYAEGGSFFYLGRRYRLRLEQGPAQVRLQGEECVLVLPKPEQVAARQKLVEGFLRQEGARIFGERLQLLFPWFAQQGVSWPGLRLSWMRTRWGTCNKGRGLITLSLRLLAHSLASIDYVILHELCHFIYFDHSARFHGLMTQLLPDWRQRKRELEDWAKVVSMA